MARVTHKDNVNVLKGQQDFFEIAKRALVQSKDMPSIVEFAEHPSFLNKTLYPRQKTLLKLIMLEIDNMTDYDLSVIEKWSKQFDLSNDLVQGITPDIWKRVDWLKANSFPHFREVLNITGRRGGKNHVGAIIGAYLNWGLIMLDDPQDYYGIDRSKDIYILSVATNIEQAKKHQFADLANTITNAKCFEPYLADAKEYIVALRTPADIRRIAAFEARGVKNSRLIASIRNIAVSSNAASSRGSTCYSVIFDEFAHMLVGTDGPRTSEVVYNAITPALDQFATDGFIYIPTSPYTKVGKCYELYNASLESDSNGVPSYPNMLMTQFPSWDQYEDWNDPVACGGFTFEERQVPQLYNDSMKRLEKREPDTFRVERLSQWAEVVNAYLNPRMVDKMFEPFIDASGELRELEEQERGKMLYIYYGHADPSKSENNTAAMICHAEQIPDPEDGEIWFHVIVDWMHVWDPQDFDEHQINYEEVEEDILNVLDKFRTCKVFSYDQYGAFTTVDRLKKRLRFLNPPHQCKVREEKASIQANNLKAEKFKSALGMGWVHSYKDEYGPDGTCLLEQELKFLQEKNGRVRKQEFGPIRTEDMSDCLMQCVYSLLEDNFRKLELRDRLAGTSLGIGAQGGYHTGNLPDWSKLSARDRLKQFGAQKSSSRINAQYPGMFRNRPGRGRG